MYKFSIKRRIRRFYIVDLQSRGERNVRTCDARTEQPRSQGSLLLRERTLVAAGHVEMCVNKLHSGVGPPPKFCRLNDEILSGVERKFLLQNDT